VDDPDLDERMRRLQRTAYGAVASDAERAAAVAQLEAIRRELTRTAEEAERADAAGPVPTGPLPATPVATGAFATGAVAVAQAAARTPAARSLKAAIAVGAAALVVGVAVGWQAGARTTVSEPTAADPAALGAATSITLGVGEVVSVPIEASTAYEVFDRPAAATDLPAVSLPPDWYDQSTMRLLATTPDGVSVYGTKALDEAANDVCVVIAHPAGAVGGSCTSGGMFEHGRLQSSLHLQGAAYSATWHADGSVQVTVPRG